MFTTHPDNYFPVGRPAPPQTPLLSWGALPPGNPPSLISLNMILVGQVTWKCILLSDLRSLEVFTIFGSENPRSAYYFPV